MAKIDWQSNAAVYDRYANRYVTAWELRPPEQSLLKRFRTRWAEIDMLDIGVGAGRTAYTFAAVARTYVGIDYSQEMISLSQQLVGEDETTRFLVCDARDLSPLYDNPFNFVFFSANGIDSIEHADRLKALREIRKVIKDDGHFAFSAHSLCALPFDLGLPRFAASDPARSAYRIWRKARAIPNLARANRSLDLDAALQRGWVGIRDQANDFKMLVYYITPETQLLQLAEAGFTECEVYDREGRAVDPAKPGGDLWLHYVCRPRP